jgi:hypothetical protein
MPRQMPKIIKKVLKLKKKKGELHLRVPNFYIFLKKITKLQNVLI